MTSTISLTPRLSEVARHLVIPEGIETTVFPRVEQRLEKAGIAFDQWQRGFGTIALGCRADGKFAATVGGVVASIPRQVGKTFTVGSLLIGLGLEFPGFQVAWTSHHNRTTTRTFQSMRALVRRKQIYPLLDHSARSDGTRAANGEQEIRFKNGSTLMFGAREQGFGRGLDEIDVEVFDEAQILTLKALEDMVPAVNQARNPHGGLLFFLGTPPRPTDPGEAFSAKRGQAISGKSRDIVFVEADPDDESQWLIMNPSYPLRTPRESILRMRDNIPDDESFKREAMGIWPEVSRHVAVIKPSVWKDLHGRGPDADVAPDELGVDMSHGLDISVAGCWLSGVSAHVEELWAGSDVNTAVEWIAAVAGRRIEVIIDDISPASQMIPLLQAKNVRVRRSTARDMAKGCLMFETRANSGVSEPLLTHVGQDSLTRAVMGARKRPISDAGGWGWDRRDSTAVIHPVVAATLALLGAVSRGVKKKNPAGGRRAIVM
jgi:hypothetical protein